jgi:hypothetical protein
MHIIRDEKKSTLTLVPVESEELETINLIADQASAGEKLKYAGRGSYPDYPRDKFVTVNLEFGDNVRLTLRGSTEADRFAINDIRNMCYYGSGKLIFLGKTTVDGATAIVVTNSYCELCGAPMATALQAESKICDACAEKCEHTYKTGLVHGPGVSMGLGEFCTICKRTKPGPLVESPSEQFTRGISYAMEVGMVDGYILI